MRLFTTIVLAFFCATAFSYDNEKIANSSVKTIDDMILYAQQQINKPYADFGAGPEAFCGTGLVTYVFSSVGIDLPSSVDGLMASGKKITKEKKLEEGDVVFFKIKGENVVGLVYDEKDNGLYDVIYVSKEYGVTIGSNAYAPFAGNFVGARRIISEKELEKIHREHKKMLKKEADRQKKIEKAEKKEAKAQKKAEKAQKKLEKAQKKVHQAKAE